MVQEGIVLAHRISHKRIEVDKAKIQVIEKLPPPISVKGIRSFSGHAEFYRSFIKDFSKITKPLCSLLEKNTPFNFFQECLHAFNTFKEKLITAPFIVAPNWNLPFELMYDASDYAIGVVLEQMRDKILHVIYYACRTLIDAQLNYATTEKEMLTVMGWVFLLQEFDLKIRDKKGIENVIADHLSRLEQPVEVVDGEINEVFPDEQLLQIMHILQATHIPWYADHVNFLASGSTPSDLSYQERTRFFADIKRYFGDDHLFFKRGPDQIIRKCVPEEEMEQILEQCHSSPYGGHFGAIKTASKVLQSDFYWPSYSKMLILLSSNATNANAMWVEAVAVPTNDARVIVNFLKKKYLLSLCGQVEISNRELKRILELTVGASKKDWSKKLDNALWAYCTAFKIPIRQQVLLYNSQLRLFPGKLRSRWLGPFTIAKIFPHGAVELHHEEKGNFKVNGQLLKPYFGGDFSKITSGFEFLSINLNMESLISAESSHE
ncbi:uncharacterized protein LOC111390517 [Olea europaea var. sylvestris]|uniref:uncharacterized protein LOC111390517 n=1 Tax=Olea europaea var. sylvestris TaxID=158386 RepID=UPI000C1D5769|nr:uncharacterized protein LOC111390517 [Olea europaea var. sylvestris]